LPAPAKEKAEAAEEETAEVEEEEKKYRRTFPAEDDSFIWRRLAPRYSKVLRSPRFPVDNEDTKEQHFYEKLMLYVPYKDEEQLAANFPNPEEGWKDIEAEAARQEANVKPVETCCDEEERHMKESTLGLAMGMADGTEIYPVSIIRSFSYFDCLGDTYMEALQQVAKDRQAAALRGEEGPVVAPGAQDEDEADRADAERSESEEEASDDDDDYFGNGTGPENRPKKLDPKDHLSGITRSHLVQWDTKMAETIRTLKRGQRAFLDHFSHWVKTRPNEPLRDFFSGPAGTGKSRLLEAMWMVANRYYARGEVGVMVNRDDAIYVLTVAPTGKAAVNIAGLTAHSALKLPVKEEFRRLAQDKMFALQIKLADLKVLIIDEISMVGANAFFRIQDRLNQLFTGSKACRNDYDFGGLHVIVFGDFYQLPPVKDQWIFRNTYGMAFSLWRGTGDKEHTKGPTVKEAKEKKQVYFMSLVDILLQ